VYVTAEPVQFGDRHVAPEFPCGGQGGLELRAAVQSVGALACLHLDELPRDGEALCLGEIHQSMPLGLDA
jgi:hypothetical protein